MPLRLSVPPPGSRAIILGNYRRRELGLFAALPNDSTEMGATLVAVQTLIFPVVLPLAWWIQHDFLCCADREFGVERCAPIR